MEALLVLRYRIYDRDCKARIHTLRTSELDPYKPTPSPGGKKSD